MLIHLRITVPESLTDSVIEVLAKPEWVTNLVVQRGVCLEPEGDLIECDAAREITSVLLDRLTAAGVAEHGGIVVSRPSATPFAAVSRLEKAAPGDPEDAVIWRAVRQNADGLSRPSVSYHLFLVLAVILAAIAVVQDSPILVVGAMVVGPEFAAVAAVCVGLVFGQRGLVTRSLRLLVYGFAFAIVTVAALFAVARGFGLVTAEMVTRPRPQTGFIWHPDGWSLAVAAVAGMAGVLALATERTSTMVGVFISVTTVPAAGNLALGLALWQGNEIRGSAAQLGINLVGMIVAGTIFLLVQRRVWQPLTRGAEHLFGTAPLGH